LAPARVPVPVLGVMQAAAAGAAAVLELGPAAALASAPCGDAASAPVVASSAAFSALAQSRRVPEAAW